FSLNHHAEAELLEFDERSRAVDHASDWRVLRPDHFVTGDHRAQPVRKVYHLRAADAGKEIFVAAGKTDHFVRESRAANDDLVVIEDRFVRSDLDRLPQHPAGDLCDLALRDFAKLDHLARLIPTVVEDVDSREPRRSLFGSGADVAVDRLLAHRLMRAESD